MNKGFQARQIDNPNGDYGIYIHPETARRELEKHRQEWMKNYKPLPENTWWNDEQIINPMIKYSHTWGKFFRYDFINWICVVPFYLILDLFNLTIPARRQGANCDGAGWAGAASPQTAAAPD